MIIGGRENGKSISLVNLTEYYEKQKEKNKVLTLIVKNNLDIELIEVCKSYGIYKAHCKMLMFDCAITRQEFLLIKKVVEEVK